MARPVRGWIVGAAVGLLAWWAIATAMRDPALRERPPAASPAPVEAFERNPEASGEAGNVPGRSRRAGTLAAWPRSDPRQVAMAQALLDESRRLHACEELLSHTERQLEEQERRIGASFEELAHARGVAYDPASTAREIQDRIAAKLGQRRDCQALPPALIASWWDRLERAALGGNLLAMEDYGSLVVRASDDDGLFDRIDEMARRKRLGYDFLRQVAARGNCQVSGALERLSPDATHRYAFALVSVEMTRRFNDRLDPGLTADNVRFMQSQADRAGAGLDAAHREEARRLASQVVLSCRQP